MELGEVEWVVRCVGAVSLVVAWIGSAVAAARALRRAPGRASGVARRYGVLAAYALAAGPYLALCVIAWQPIPLEMSEAARIACLAVGCVLGAAGFTLYVWGRLALGDMYNLSSSLGSALFADQRLVVRGPYRVVRHPMYLGIMASALGGLLVYRTWTTVFVTLALPGLVVKSRHEDRLLADEFGPAFETYRASVPAWWPRPSGGHHDASERASGPSMKEV